MTDFVSDNHAPAHPRVLDAIAAANSGHAGAYGDDGWTQQLEEVCCGHFGPDARTFPVFNGSGANVAALAALATRHEAVVCTDVAHIHVDECGAPEQLAGVKLLTVATEHGKLTADDVARWEHRRGDEHAVQPRVVSITQASELGTVYTRVQTREIADAAHALGMYVHVDGARLANAAAALGESLRTLTTDAGVDVVSFGGTKNGLAFGEAVVFCDGELAEGFAYTRKRLGQLASKQRFISAQLIALLEDDLWLENARHANEMAKRFGSRLEVEVAHPVESNAVFARAGGPPAYVWDAGRGVCRFMCSWDTLPEDVDAFASQVR
ncbi:MAG TPA: beta-eliminating lyase-related protein [Gaiellaceae bacterium]|jgi:threonine aldolase